MLLIAREDVIRDGVPGIVDTNEKQQQRGPADEKHPRAFIGVSNPC